MSVNGLPLNDRLPIKSMELRTTTEGGVCLVFELESGAKTHEIWLDRTIELGDCVKLMFGVPNGQFRIREKLN